MDKKYKYLFLGW